MLLAEAGGSNDKRASFSAILKLVGGPLLSLTNNRQQQAVFTVGDETG
jgi:hypothetical protein